ncbi:ABC transporter ATP-binding protein [Microlunatus flavus]|uniref:Putative ABC transport system ATP-binding protein n=1 Tax=Microlunatus flavus TaxID=1036181 RepID=A0A1H9FXM0_9ACTN|nr:ATP-binding cassette domain-containing protein [Microlunatus flavus]SEQ42559.1 putative ABC transport system ATP-binding protein [Microlunatus flavus]
MADGRRAVELSARDLHVSRGGVEVLRGVDLTLRGGERVALTGPSGSGKTVLLTVLAGFAVPERGAVLLDGRPLVDHGRGLRPRLGVVFQGYGLVALLTAAENVELPLLAAGLPTAQARGRAREALDAVGLGERSEHLVEELSGGQQQRAAVARALALRPDVLLADEPTAEQDVAHRAGTLDAILATARTGTAVVLATHDPDVAARCDSRVHLEAGLLRPA